MESFPDLISTLTDTVTTWFEGFIEVMPSLLVAILIVVAFGALGILARRITYRILDGLTHNAQVSNLLATIAKITMIAVGLSIALGILDLDKAVTSLLAGVGVVGLALGFAFQDIASNFVAGFVMAINRPFKEGDLVEVNGRRGRVLKVNLRSTELETLDGLTILVPNKSVFQYTIVNYTLTNSRRMDLAVGTAYGDDMEAVRRVVKAAVESLADREQSREVELFYEGFGSSSINFMVRVWLAKADELTYLNARSEAMIAIKKALDAAGFTIPFPIRTLDFGAAEIGGRPINEMEIRVARDEAGSLNGP